MSRKYRLLLEELLPIMTNVELQAQMDDQLAVIEKVVEKLQPTGGFHRKKTSEVLLKRVAQYVRRNKSPNLAPKKGSYFFSVQIWMGFLFP